MRALVTGGAGYIGAHMVATLAASGHEILVLDDLSTGHPDTVPDQAQLLQADLRHPGEWVNKVKQWRPDVTFHFAARSIVAESVQQPWEYLSGNTKMTLHLLEAIPEESIFIFSSSCSIYGRTKSMPIAESAAANPESPYAESKRIGEKLVESFCRERRLRAVSLRYFNVSGCAHPRLRERHEPETHLIPNLLLAAHSGTPFHLHGTQHPTPDGTAIRDFVHVSDLAQAHLAASHHLLDSPRGFFDCFNLGRGEGASVLEVLRIAEKITGRHIQIQYHPPRPGDAPCLVADNRKWKAWANTPATWQNAESMIRSAWEALTS